LSATRLPRVILNQLCKHPDAAELPGIEPRGARRWRAETLSYGPSSSTPSTTSSRSSRAGRATDSRARQARHILERPPSSLSNLDEVVAATFAKSRSGWRRQQREDLQALRGARREPSWTSGCGAHRAGAPEGRQEASPDGEDRGTLRACSPTTARVWDYQGRAAGVRASLRRRAADHMLIDERGLRDRGILWPRRDGHLHLRWLPQERPHQPVPQKSRAVASASRGWSLKEGDFIEHLFIHDDAPLRMVFTQQGEGLQSSCQLPRMGRTAKAPRLPPFSQDRDPDRHRDRRTLSADYLLFATRRASSKKTPFSFHNTHLRRRHHRRRPLRGRRRSDRGSDRLDKLRRGTDSLRTQPRTVFSRPGEAHGPGDRGVRHAQGRRLTIPPSMDVVGDGAPADLFMIPTEGFGKRTLSSSFQGAGA